MENRGGPPGTPSSPGMKEDRFEALLEARFRDADRATMAREIATHDQDSPAGVFDEAHVRRKLRFHGAIPDKVQRMLREWVPALLAHAAARGVRLRDLNHEIHLYHPDAWAEATGSPPRAGMRLPATSCEYQPISRVYEVNLVMPPQVGSLEALLSVFRALISRLLGDIYLREEIFTQEAYRAEEGGKPEEVTIGLPEKLKLLAELPVTTPGLANALEVHAKLIGANLKRAGTQVCKSYFDTLGQQAENGALSELEQALIDEAMAAYLASLQGDLPRQVAATVAEVDKLNTQMNFLPVDELPDYQKLRAGNPVHYLRAAKLRLVFLLEVLAALLEDFEELTAESPRLSPVLEERVDGQLAELRAQGLVRPYLLENVRLSDELNQQLAAFPLEVHALMQRMPSAANPDKLFNSLSKKIAGSIYQRLYTALVLFQAWFRARDGGREKTFTASEQFTRLKGLMANFRFRHPILEALFLQLGIVLDMAEAAGAEAKGGGAQRRIPQDALLRAWSQFLPHTLVATFFADGTRLPGFDAAQYTAKVTAALRSQVAKGPGTAHLAYVLHCLHREAGDEGLAILAGQLADPSGTWRFAVTQALAPPPPKQADDPQARLSQLEEWARLVLTARESSQRNAIVIGEDGTVTAP